MLKVRDVHSFYGPSHVLFGVSLEVNRGEVVSLLGRNGAGKTTTMRSIINLTSPRSGSITYQDSEITGKQPFQLARMGLGYVPDNRRIFPDLTVGENLELGRQKGSVGGKRWDKDKVYQLFPALKLFEKRKGGFLSGGEQQMLSIARALMGGPQLLLLDEPTEGLAPLVVLELEKQILTLKNEGISILLAEQNVKSALKLMDRGYIIDSGHIRYHGSVEELKVNEEIRKKYLLI